MNIIYKNLIILLLYDIQLAKKVYKTISF
jgi:hypothetical protein